MMTKRSFHLYSRRADRLATTKSELDYYKLLFVLAIYFDFFLSWQQIAASFLCVKGL